ncbi:putative arsenite methyltransferase [Halalkalicoccus paucihalophilus]|uniref:Putative arsenite methyltransferase n=1 Tax=Halalkalicoccus paucihalophilus TaxID=1008153 RepID=A0A151A8S2_9EURY|nr:methyltransferase domain-containing protein [Halalkalicoccus paucihalophilus]KYH24019.1 putative arsenite methyltransferase [Halalkalicoccus paucihalophilus]
MGDTLEYTDEEAQQEESTFKTPPARARRQLVRERLDFQPDDNVLSIGCGPGFEPAEIAEGIGQNGHVHAIDQSEAMLTLAEQRCSSTSNITLSRADAVALPFADDAFDAAVAVQVYEYIENLDTALAELARILRPGGRAVVYDTDFDSLIWHATDQERIGAICEAFNDHCPRPHLGSQLAPHLRNVGLAVEWVEPNSILNTRLDEETFAYHLMEAIKTYVVTRGKITEDVATAWIDDLQETDDLGNTFFNLTQYLYVIQKPNE